MVFISRVDPSWMPRIFQLFGLLGFDRWLILSAVIASSAASAWDNSVRTSIDFGQMSCWLALAWNVLIQRYGIVPSYHVPTMVPEQAQLIFHVLSICFNTSQRITRIEGRNVTMETGWKKKQKPMDGSEAPACRRGVTMWGPNLGDAFGQTLLQLEFLNEDDKEDDDPYTALYHPSDPAWSCSTGDCKDMQKQFSSKSQTGSGRMARYWTSLLHNLRAYTISLYPKWTA